MGEERLTCDQLAEIWPKRWPRPDETTNANNAAMVKGFARDFRHRDPRSIEKSEARAWAMEHPSAHRYVRAMFFDAEGDGLVDRNVWANLRLSASRGRKDLVIPTDDQIAALVNAAGRIGEHEFGQAITFAAATGARLGEVRAAEVQGFLGAHRFSIEWQIDRSERRKKPKGKKGERLVLLMPLAHGIEEWVLGVDWSGPDVRLWPLTLYQFKDRWKKVRKEAALERWVQWHELRHYCATKLLDAGASAEDVAIQLGHDDGGTLVRELYGHPDPDLALARLESCIGND